MFANFALLRGLIGEEFKLLPLPRLDIILTHQVGLCLPFPCSALLLFSLTVSKPIAFVSPICFP